MTTLKDKLSHLSYLQACKLLGKNGNRLILQGGKWDIDLFEQVKLDNEQFSLNLGGTVVKITLNPANPRRLKLKCNRCSGACEHQGAALSMILEEKLSLGLSVPPPERVPMESLDEKALVKQALDDRQERAETEKMRLKSLDPGLLWTDYTVTNQASGKSYRIALRGWELGQSFCSCPDFRKNTLGTCKHILHALGKARKKFNRVIRETPAEINGICVYLKYGRQLELRLLIPEKLDPAVAQYLSPFKEKSIRDAKALIRCIRQVENAGSQVTIYPDAEEYMNHKLFQARIAQTVADIRKDPANHPLRNTLLNAELLPYQLDGIAFSVGAGRAVLADDMGLGKTIQGIGVAELLSRYAPVKKVLVICPASLKSQWRIEIERFSNRSCRLVLGSAEQRAHQYASDDFFCVCNYEQVLRDYLSIERTQWDLIILDEGQRIKNWEAKTSRMVKALKSTFALVLSGTPLENRIDELFSVVEFIDDRRLGPAFRFFNRHKVVDEKGKVLGYKKLDRLRKKLKPLMLRRTRQEVMADLPPRTTDILRIPPTEEQFDMNSGYARIIQTIINKKYLTEMDLLRLQKALLMCRMCANSTFLVDKQPPGYSSKLAELDQLLDQLLGEKGRKIVLFSEWTTMLNLIEALLEKYKAAFVRLDGSVPQKKRQGLMHQFQNDPDCQLFITTNAGSTGLNLQAADTVINVDLPWNPAVLEQRISRVHRMGQKRPVQVYLLVTRDTLEENMLATLSAKHELSLAVLDPESETTDVNMATGMEELKRRLEILLGTKPEPAEDESMRTAVEKEAYKLAKKRKVAAAGGQLVGAAFAFIGEMFSEQEKSEKVTQLTGAFKEKLSECLEKTEDGKLEMTISLPDEAFLDNMARSLAHMVRSGQK